MKNPCSNPEPHEVGSLPCCEGIYFASLNTNIDEPTVDELIELIQSKSSPLLDFNKKRLKEAVEALLSAARIDELERLWPSITVDGYFTVDGETIKERIKELKEKQ